MLVSMIEDAEPRQWGYVLTGFLYKRAERSLLISFIGAEASLVGFLPAWLNGRVRIETLETSFDLFFG